MSNAIGRRELLGGLALIATLPSCAAPHAPPIAPSDAVPPATAAPPTGAASSASPTVGAPASVSPTVGAPQTAGPRGVVPTITPLGDATFARRADRARALAREAGASVVFVTSGTTSFAYLAGGRVERSERLIALVVPLDGEPFLVAPAFEVERIRRQTRVQTVRPWEERDNPFAIVRDALGPKHARAKLLIEPHTEYQAAQALARALPGAILVDGTTAFERLRVHKDDDELARIRGAIAVTHDVFDAAFAGLRPGVRDREVSEAIAADFRARGHDGYALVQFGPLSALPHGHPSGDALADGTVVLIDGGCAVDGYWSDITRTRWFGATPSAEFTKVYDVVREAQRAAIALVRPGVPAQDLDRAARAVITKAGYGPYFTHRLGHGLGMDGHEPCYLVEGNTQLLEPGFVFTTEPGIYLPDKFGVRIEDDVLCGPSGPILLSRPV